MTLIGYDAYEEKITDGNGRLSLVHSSGEEAATWKFTDLMTHWIRKHPLAAYAPSMHEKAKNAYRYGSSVRLGEDTDFLHFLRAMSAGKVYYDPGIKLEDASSDHPKSKRRSQFRIKICRSAFAVRQDGTNDSDMISKDVRVVTRRSPHLPKWEV
jgi:hypothetical protein